MGISAEWGQSNLRIRTIFPGSPILSRITSVKADQIPPRPEKILSQKRLTWKNFLLSLQAAHFESEFFIRSDQFRTPLVKADQNLIRPKQISVRKKPTRKVIKKVWISYGSDRFRTPLVEKDQISRRFGQIYGQKWSHRWIFSRVFRSPILSSNFFRIGPVLGFFYTGGSDSRLIRKNFRPEKAVSKFFFLK